MQAQATDSRKRDADGGTASRLRQVAEGSVAALGLEFVHLDYRKEGRRWVLRLYVDRPGGGVTLDDCARASEQLSAALDAADVIPHRYTLEVSSPGLDRPLFTEADYRRFAGRRARITTQWLLDGRRHHQGRLAGCEAGAVLMKLAGGQDCTIPFEMIASGRLEIELDHEVKS